MHQQVFGAAVSDHLVPEVARNAFTAIVPEDDSAVAVYQVNTRREAVEDCPESFRR
jgi:hypothetical protein